MTTSAGGARPELADLAAQPSSAPPSTPGPNVHVHALRQAGPVTSSHADIFLLPCPGLEHHGRRQRRAAARAASRRRAWHAGVVESIVALNALAS
eukprot:1775972-Pyramimonas_sp.AAC.1